jgi:hypothetical protein
MRQKGDILAAAVPPLWDQGIGSGDRGRGFRSSESRETVSGVSREGPRVGIGLGVGTLVGVGSRVARVGHEGGGGLDLVLGFLVFKFYLKKKKNPGLTDQPTIHKNFRVLNG